MDIAGVFVLSATVWAQTPDLREVSWCSDVSAVAYANNVRVTFRDRRASAPFEPAGTEVYAWAFWDDNPHAIGDVPILLGFCFFEPGGGGSRPIRNSNLERSR